MLRALRSASPAFLLAVLCGIVLIGGLLATSTRASASFTENHAPKVFPQDIPAEDSTTTTPDEDTTPSIPEEESAAESVLEVLFGIVILGPIIALILGLLLAFPTVLLGVSLVMDGGCLRYLLFGVGWVFSMFYGGIVGAVIGEMILGLGFLIKPIFYVFMWGYPVAAYWGYKKLQAMPEEQYRAWDQTLTGGALLGFGAGSIAGLARSAASGFGGFGGGSFGGGGASGSWGGASGAASASAGAGSAGSAAVGASAGTAGGTSGAAVATGAASGAAAASSSSTPDRPEQNRGGRSSLRQWFDKFQWYHGVIFVLVTLVFVPLGLGAMQALQNTTFLVFVLVCTAVYSGYRFLRRNPEAPQSALRTISSFQGGGASSSWS